MLELVIIILKLIAQCNGNRKTTPPALIHVPINLSFICVIFLGLVFAFTAQKSKSEQRLTVKGEKH